MQTNREVSYRALLETVSQFRYLTEEEIQNSARILWSQILNREDAIELNKLWKATLAYHIDLAKSYRVIHHNMSNTPEERVAAYNYKIHKIRPALRNLNQLKIILKSLNAKRIQELAHQTA